VAQDILPTDSTARKEIPLVRGLLDYFPAALAEIAKVSKAGNDKHNPGEELHHARGKSMDHADCIVRHLVDRGGIDPDDNQRHSAKMAWRALALLQEELEAAGAPMPRAARPATIGLRVQAPQLGNPQVIMFPNPQTIPYQPGQLYGNASNPTGVSR
jgi:hypothetical protein